MINQELTRYVSLVIITNDISLHHLLLVDGVAMNLLRRSC